MRELVLDLGLREAYCCQDPLWDVHNCSNYHFNILSFNKILQNRALLLGWIATDKELGHMIRVWLLPDVLLALKPLLNLLVVCLEVIGLAHLFLDNIESLLE